MNKKRTIAVGQVACFFCVAIILLAFCSICLRFFARQVLVKRLQMENAVISTLFFDAQELMEENNGNKVEADTILVDWQDMYPFYQSNAETIMGSEDTDSVANHYYTLVLQIENGLEPYTSRYLVGYQKMVTMCRQYERLLRWNFASYSEYNGVITLNDGQLTTFSTKKDVSGAAVATVDLAKECEEKEIKFLYVQIPTKICKYDDTDISGKEDFSNQNADAFLSILKENNVDYLDIRDLIHEQGLKHHALFYVTDHHWRAETGLWAAKQIIEYLNKQYDYQVAAEALNSDRFDAVVYSNWFLGSHGKKVTLASTKPDDFELLYPKEKTDFRLVIPDKEIDSKGDFSITYNMNSVEELDYYGKNPYGAYIHANRPLEQIENGLAENDLKALVIHDSFGNCVIPFMAMEFKYMDALYLGKFTGSVQRYIEVTNPNIVIVMYYPGSLEDVDYQTHDGMCDFR